MCQKWSSFSLGAHTKKTKRRNHSVHIIHHILLLPEERELHVSTTFDIPVKTPRYFPIEFWTMRLRKKKTVSPSISYDIVWLWFVNSFFFLVKRKQLFSHSDLSDQTDKKMSSIITVWKPKFLQQILVSLSLYMMVSCLIPQLDCEEGGSDASNFGSKSDIMMMITIPQSF